MATPVYDYLIKAYIQKSFDTMADLNAGLAVKTLNGLAVLDFLWKEIPTPAPTHAKFCEARRNHTFIRSRLSIMGFK